jgi:hypothetical protein
VVLFDPSEGEYKQALDPDSADALLISAAPDLLSALMMAVSALERSDYIQMDSFDVIEVSREAIAKARGEE